MKKMSFLFMLVLMLVSVQIYGQLINVNPDPNGDPWWVGDCIPPSPEEMALVTEFVTSPEALAVLLPAKVYNNELMYFPPIFYQQGGSCVQAAEVGYNFTYEINRFRGVAAGDWDQNKENCYHHLFAYNYVNDGEAMTGSDIYDGFKVIKENGCPEYEVYDDPAIEPGATEKFKYWMTGYDNYLSGMHNRISSYHTFTVNNPDPLSLDPLKHWLYNHSTTGEDPGGLAIISVYADGWDDSQTIPPESPEEHDLKLLTQWGNSGLHALTIVGYNDDIWCFDINNDDEYTNDIDVDGDQDVDLFDFEKGAFKVANSWGTEDFGNDGFIFVPYKLMAAGLGWEKAYFCNVEDEYEPLLMLKTSIEYNRRRQLYFTIGMAQFANQNQPQFSRIPLTFLNRGGCNIMRGVSTYEGPIELGLDFGYWFLNADFGKIFFSIFESEQGCAPGEGTINNFSIIDKRWGETFELSDPTTVPIVQNGQTFRVIEYDLLPHHEELIRQDLTLSSNMVSRFKPTVTNGASLTVENSVKIDMYNSELIIEEGSSLIIGDNVIFHASRGTSKIYIQGSIQIGSEVTFTADEGSTLEIYFGPQSVYISNCHFENCIISGGNFLDITQSEFKKSFVNKTISNLSISFSDFTNSSIIASNPTMGPIPIDNTASITYCNFETAYDGANSMIEIYGYKSFEISNCTINNGNNPESAFHGVSVHYSGTTESGNVHIISDNLIYCSSGLCDNLLAGITVYSAIADIRNNYINSNQIGVQSLNYSRLYIIGYQGANDESQTQRIKNNTFCQVFASRNAFPLEMHWNAIYGNASDCFVIHEVDMSSHPPEVYVENNYWGPSFDPDINLCPIRHYYYEPIWILNGGQILPNSAQQLFELGISQIDDNDYSEAKSTFQEVVTSYPEEEPAKNSLKEILYLEPLVANDFEELKNWYLTDSVILNHNHLQKLAENLANKCDEKLENYPDAIDWYESIIENPETIEDSVFAIIDLEHLYWQMGIDTNLRSSSYVGRLSQFKPKSFKAFKDHKDELLLLLHGANVNNMSNPEIPSYNAGTQLMDQFRNIPNPFKGKTNIYYNLDIESDIELNIYNNIGQLVKSFNEAGKPKGTHIIEFDAAGMQAGIYFYSISINGITINSKKMLKL